MSKAASPGQPGQYGRVSKYPEMDLLDILDAGTKLRYIEYSVDGNFGALCSIYSSILYIAL